MSRTHDTNDDSIWSGDVSDRFRDAINHVGGLKKCSDLVGVTAEQVGRWRDGKSKAPFTSVALIVTAAGRNLDWLIKGETEAGKAGRRGAEIDENLMAQIADAITDVFKQENMPLPPGHFGRLLARKYREIAATANNQEEVDVMIKLIATQLRNDIRNS